MDNPNLLNCLILSRNTLPLFSSLLPSLSSPIFLSSLPSSIFPPLYLLPVVIRVQLSKQKNRPEAQTKDRSPAIVWPYVSIMRRWAICLYWLAVGVELGHMFLLCGARLYVSIGWL